MEIPSMITWIDGETVTPQQMNEQIRDSMNFVLSGRPRCRVAQKVSTQSLPHFAWTAIEFDTEDYDTDTMYDNPTSASNIAIETAGVYLITGSVSFDINTAGNSRNVRINSSSSGVLADNRMPPLQTVSVAPAVNVSTVAYLSAGEVVTLEALQDSGAALNTWVNAAQDHSRLSIIWLGA